MTQSQPTVVFVLQKLNHHIPDAKFEWERFFLWILCLTCPPPIHIDMIHKSLSAWPGWAPPDVSDSTAAWLSAFCRGSGVVVVVVVSVSMVLGRAFKATRWELFTSDKTCLAARVCVTSFRPREVRCWFFILANAFSTDTLNGRHWKLDFISKYHFPPGRRSSGRQCSPTSSLKGLEYPSQRQHSFADRNSRATVDLLRSVASPSETTANRQGNMVNFRINLCQVCPTASTLHQNTFLMKLSGISPSNPGESIGRFCQESRVKSRELICYTPNPIYPTGTR